MAGAVVPGIDIGQAAALLEKYFDDLFRDMSFAFYKDRQAELTRRHPSSHMDQVLRGQIKGDGGHEPS